MESVRSLDYVSKISSNTKRLIYRFMCSSSPSLFNDCRVTFSIEKGNMFKHQNIETGLKKCISKIILNKFLNELINTTQFYK